MAVSSKRRTRRVFSSGGIPPQSDRYRVLACINDTMQEYAVRQGALNFIWWFDRGSVSNFEGEGGPPDTGPPDTGPPDTGPPDIEPPYVGPSGILDTSFGTNGFNFATPTTWDVIYSLALRPDDEILAGGHGITSFAVGQYNSDGSLDTTFATNGFNVSTPGTGDQVKSIALQPDGKLVVAGRATKSGLYTFALGRYNLDGSLDTLFATNGFNVTTPSGKDQLNSVVVQQNGQFIAGGNGEDESGTSTPCLARYNSNGSLDTSFVDNGYDSFNADGGTILSVVLQPNGSILAGGYCNANTTSAFLVFRFNSDGSVDGEFTENSINAGSPGTGDGINALVLQPDGKIVAGGYATVAGGSQVFAVARYNSDGSLDTEFGVGGYSLVSPGAHDQINALVLQPDGKILAGGSSGSTAPTFALARYNSDGSLDTSFGTDGYNLSTPGHNDMITAVVLQSTNQIIAGGQATRAGVRTFVLARYT